jgi:RND superfamily putative drug exporter
VADAPAGKSGLLYALGGHVARIEGDLKVLGHVLPQHSATARREVALIRCRDTPDPVGEVTAALAEGVRLLLIDDLDLVVATAARKALLDLLDAVTPDGQPVSVVLTAHDPSLLTDLLPQGKGITTVTLLPKLAEVP